METVIEKRRCTGCHACFNACPTHAIRMEEDAEGFLYPIIDQDKCVHCASCREVCPALTPPKKNNGDKTYACAAENLDVRLGSSSGAVFALLAENVLHEGGLVCGAAYLAPDHIGHILIADQSQLSQVRGTKYVQSEIGDVFEQIKTALKKGRKVLFSGTGCQVAGLINYLERDSVNLDLLVTVDIICHGVPSPGVWREYLKELGKESPVVDAAFRVKDRVEKKTGFYCLLENGRVIAHEQKDDLFVKGFLQNLYLRPSCFDCSFKGIKRCSDLTIGDFWSAKEYHPDLDDGLGVSAVIVHSEKGENAIQPIFPKMKWEKSTPEKAAYWNECLVSSVQPTEKRETFYARVGKENLQFLLEELTQTKQMYSSKPGFIKIVMRKTKELFSK